MYKKQSRITLTLKIIIIIIITIVFMHQKDVGIRLCLFWYCCVTVYFFKLIFLVIILIIQTVLTCSYQKYNVFQPEYLAMTLPFLRRFKVWILTCQLSCGSIYLAILPRRIRYFYFLRKIMYTNLYIYLYNFKNLSFNFFLRK